MLHRSKDSAVADSHFAMLFLRLTCMAFCIGVAASVAVSALVLVVAAVGD